MESVRKATPHAVENLAPFLCWPLGGSVELDIGKSLALVAWGDLEVLHRGLDLGVAEDAVEDDDVAAAAQPVHGEAVPELVRVARRGTCA